MTKYEVKIATQEEHEKLVEEMTIHSNMEKEYKYIVFTILSNLF